MPIEPARFWTKVSAVEEGPLGCWPWLGALARPDGRALVNDPDLGRPTQAARVAWQLSHHPVPDGLQVLHLCDHPWCVRPTHLVVGSQAANVADRLRKQWVRISFRPRHPEPPRHDSYQTATQVRARHRKLAAAAGQQLALFELDAVAAPVGVLHSSPLPTRSLPKRRSGANS